MELRQISDDFFTIGNITILYKKTENDVYDFNFRNHFECKSVISEVEHPVLLRIGAVEDYEGLEEMIESMGMKLLVHYAEHLRCSTIEEWYPAIKDKTPFTKIYDELPDIEEIERDFSFPIFIKGNRQTNRHNKAQCIIENADAYEQLKDNWKKDSILSWQKVAVREYVKLQTIDDTSYPEMVPISYEFRFFCFEGKCIGYGPYWYMGSKYSMNPNDSETAIKLAEWAAQRVAVEFIAVDLAKTADGEWIIIEVNDAQESGFVGLNALSLWHNAIEAMQERNWISGGDMFNEDTFIMGVDQIPDVTVKEMNLLVAQAETEKELADAYAMASNKAWCVEDDIYDYEEGTLEHQEACKITEEWFAVTEHIRNRIFGILKSEGIEVTNQSYIEELKLYMARNGYRDGRGWWIQNNNE